MFGSYDIIETVGQGGMGIVYRAMDVSLDREVAVKVLKEDLRTHPQVVARFQREAEAFASLNHPNIVHIYSVGAVGKIPYIAMEFIHGEPLSDIMKRERRMEWKRVLLLGEQVAKALSTAHDSHIIHRDIKPGNILVGKNDHAFVTDFGIAKILTAETQLTVEGSRLGTPQYMSPERCRNEDALASSDLYSLGVLLFQMISGRLPFEGANPVELVHKIISQPAKRLSEYYPEIPRDVERLIAYLIEKDPRDRPPSGLEWAELSERVREGKPLFEDSDGMSESMRNFRETMPTPTPFGSGSSSNLLDNGLIGSIRKWWRRLGPSMQWGVISVPVLVMALWFGFLYDRMAHRDYAYDTVAGLEYDMASWERNLEAASILQEAPGVRLIQVHMPGYTVSPIIWIDSNTALVTLTGPDGSGETALRGAGRISLESGDMELVYPPEPLAEFSILAAQSDNERVLILRSNISTGFMDLFTVDTASIPFTSGFAGDTSFGLMSEEPEWAHVNGAVWVESRQSWFIHGIDNAADGDEGLWEYRKNATAPSLLYSPGESIHSIVAIESEVYFIRGDENAPGSLEVWLLNSNDTSPVPLVSEVTSFTQASVEANGKRMVLPIADSRTTNTELHLLDASTGENLARLGPGSHAAWHPSGRYIIALAEDRKGQLQMWGLESKSPYNRVQLTFLNDGVSGILRLAPDGNHALVGRNTNQEPELVLVDVSVEALSDQGL